MGSMGGAGCTQQDSSVGLEVAGFSVKATIAWKVSHSVCTTGTLSTLENASV